MNSDLSVKNVNIRRELIKDYVFYLNKIIYSMMLNEKQSLKFVEWYKNLYGDTSKETWTWEIPRLHESLQKEHIEMRRDFIKELLWPRNCKKIYTHRGWRKETWLMLTFNSLYFNYGPTWVDDDWNVSKIQMWLNDKGEVIVHDYSKEK